MVGRGEEAASLVCDPVLPFPPDNCLVVRRSARGPRLAATDGALCWDRGYFSNRPLKRSMNSGANALSTSIVEISRSRSSFPSRFWSVRFIRSTRPFVCGLFAQMIVGCSACRASARRAPRRRQRRSAHTTAGPAAPSVRHRRRRGLRQPPSNSPITPRRSSSLALVVTSSPSIRSASRAAEPSASGGSVTVTREDRSGSNQE